MPPFSTFIAGLLPKSRREAALYLFVFLCALRPWIVSIIAYPHDSPAVRTIYHAPEGDYEYFILINNLAKGNFGENAVYELQHTGVQSFPVASVVFHVVSVALFGSLWGYIVADIIVTAFFFFTFRAWCRLFSADALWTTFLAAVYVSGLPNITDGMAHYFHWGAVWGFRIPRPYVTDIYLLAGMVLLTRMAWHPEARGKLFSWLLVGAIMSISLQSLIYLLPALGLGAIYVALLWIIKDRPAVARVAGTFAGTLGTFLILCAPFIYQRLHEGPEIVARLGLFPVSPARIWFHTPWWTDTIVWVGLIVLALLAVLNASGTRPIPGRVFGVLATLQVAAFFGLPLVALGGKLIQAYHFFSVTASVQTCLLVALVARDLPRFIPQVLRQPVLVTSAAALILLFGFGLIPYHNQHRHLLDGPIRTDVYHPPGPDYRRAFTALVRELDRDQYKDDLVAAMNDDQVYAYWVGFHGHFAFFPQAWISTLSNQQMEDRLLWFAREEGMDGPATGRFLNEFTTLVYWLGCSLYQCSPLYHHAPVEDYAAADTARMQGSIDFGGFSLVLPLSENQRLQNRYAQILAMDEAQRPRLDLVILSADTKIPALPAPDPSRYALTYHDDYFRVYQAIRK